MQSFEQMLRFNRQFDGDVKRAYKKMQDWHIKNEPNDGVFCPSTEVLGCSPEVMTAMLSAISVFKKTKQHNSPEMSKAVSMQFGLHVFGTWRNSLGIYKIDEDIMNELVKSPIPADTPSHIFSRLPDWCVYVELPDTATSFTQNENGSIQFLGFWALLDRKPTINASHVSVLHLLPHFTVDGEYIDTGFMPIQMALSESLTVTEAVDQISSIDKSVVAALKMEESPNESDKQKRILLLLLPLLLWLCAEEPDISNIKGEPISGNALRLPKYAVHKKTGAFIPPSQPIIYHLGKRLGGEIRQFNTKKKDDELQGRLPSRKRPHIRRGHWHGVWRGTGQDKQFSIYWQPAIFVNSK